MDWTATAESEDMLSLVRRLLALRRAHPVLRQRAFFEGRAVEDGDGCKDLAWFHPAGREMADGDWFDAGLRTIGMYLDGRGLRHSDARGEVIIDDSFLLLLNSGDWSGPFTLPGKPWATTYEVVVDTTNPGGEPSPGQVVPGGTPLPLGPRTSILLRVRR